MGSYFRPKVRVDRNKVPNSHWTLASMRIDPHALSLMKKFTQYFSTGNHIPLATSHKFPTIRYLISLMMKPIMSTLF